MQASSGGNSDAAPPQQQRDDVPPGLDPALTPKALAIAIAWTAASVAVQQQVEVLLSDPNFTTAAPTPSAAPISTVSVATSTDLSIQATAGGISYYDEATVADFFSKSPEQREFLQFWPSASLVSISSCTC